MQVRRRPTQRFVVKSCRVCGKDFKTNPMSAKAFYCSHSCKRQAATKRRHEKCPLIGPLRWSRAEVDFLIENYRKLGINECSRALGRKRHGVKHKAYSLGLRPVHWTPRELSYLRAHFSVDGAVKVAAELRRNIDTVYQLAEKFGLCAPPRIVAPRPTLTARAIIARMESEHGLVAGDILSSSRRRKVCYARWRVMRELRALKYKLPKIGVCLGVDHTTCINGLRRLSEVNNPSVPTGDSSAQLLAQQEATARNTLSNASTFERLAVSDPCSQPELEAAE